MNTPDPIASDRLQSVSDRLNQTCLCVTLDRVALGKALEREAGDPTFVETFIGPRPHLFSNVPVFLSANAIVEMRECVAAIEAITRLPVYQAAVLSWAPPIAHEDHGPVGVLMGYDFHLGENGPSLIEVNTNAGGAFLNAFLARAQRDCCAEMGEIPTPAAPRFEDAVFQMFQEEWKRQRGPGSPHRIAIIDDSPTDQYLYPEFLLAKKILIERGVEAIIADASGLRYDEGRLWFDGRNIDLVYNRVTDFALDQPEHTALRDAYRNGAVVVTAESSQPCPSCGQAQPFAPVRPGAARALGHRASPPCPTQCRAAHRSGNTRKRSASVAVTQKPILQAERRSRRQSSLPR